MFFNCLKIKKVLNPTMMTFKPEGRGSAFAANFVAYRDVNNYF